MLVMPAMCLPAVSGQVVLLKLFSQCPAIDTKADCSATLIAIAVFHHSAIQRFFHLPDNQIVQITGLLAIQYFEVLTQFFFNLLLQRRTCCSGSQDARLPVAGEHLLCGARGMLFLIGVC